MFFSLVTATLSGPESSGFHRTQIDHANLKVWIKNDVFCTILFGLDSVLLSNSENREHLKILRNVDCVLANHNKVQDT